MISDIPSAPPSTAEAETGGLTTMSPSAVVSGSQRLTRLHSPHNTLRYQPAANKAGNICQEPGQECQHFRELRTVIISSLHLHCTVYTDGR